MAGHARALLYLQFFVAKNWLRRSLRSIIVWALVIGVAFFSITGAFLGGDAEPPGGESGGAPSIIFESLAVMLFLFTIGFAIWRGTGPPPKATAADVIFVLCSPIRARVQFAYLMFRDVAATLSILTIVAALSLVGPVVEALTSSASTLEGAFQSPTVGIWLIILIGGVTRLSVWVATEQVIVRDARLGHQVRWLVRGGLALTLAGIAVFVALPVIREGHETIRAMSEHAADRLMLVANVPPMSFAAMIYADDGSPFLALGALFVTALVIAGAGLLFARDFAEPIVIMAERTTDTRGQSIESGNDLQWSTISQLGAPARLRVSIHPFGSGPWAMFWCSLVRWVRYQMSVAWFSLVTLVLMAGGITVMVRLGILSTYWVWGFALSMPIFSSYNMFLDELRKPFLFMTPGAPWKRLVAAGITSVMDGMLASATLVVIVVATRAMSVGEAMLVLLASLLLGFLIQASVGLVQILLPSWLNRKIRTTLTFGLNAISLVPVGTAFIIGAVMSSLLTGFVVASLTALATAAILLTLSVVFFDRLEMPN